MDIGSLFLGFLVGSTWLYVLMVIIGLGLIIFVHEFGHFVVAKLCGVKCEKFYLGFDFFGLRLLRFRWGETEYGIGIIPLGGYVKMLGQEDNPARLREEFERAKAAGSDSGSSPGGESLASLEEVLYNPRSYLAKSVPQRMAIISAGVAMNLVFAVIAAVFAYFIGVQEIPCGVGQIAPGEGAWRAGLLPGDKIVEINGRKTHRFQDLQQSISLARRGHPVTMRIERAALPGSKVLDLQLVPDRIRVVPTIGVTNPQLPIFADPPCYPGSAATEILADLRPGAEIKAINGQPVKDYAEISRQWAQTWGEPVEITLLMPGDGAKAGREEKVILKPTPVRDFGLIFEVGRILAVRAGSPAEAAGVVPGDELTQIVCPEDVNWNGNPMRLPYVLQQALRHRPEGIPIRLVVKRSGGLEKDAVTAIAVRPSRPNEAVSPEETETLTVEVVAKSADFFADLNTGDSPLEVPQLGIVVEILPRIRGVEENSPAAVAGVRAGDQLVSVTAVPPQVDPESPLGKLAKYFHMRTFTVRFDVERGQEKGTWPFFFRELQKMVTGTEADLVLHRPKSTPAEGFEEVKMRLTPSVAEDWFLGERDLIFEAMTFDLQASGLKEAISMGAKETWTSVTLVYRVLSSLGRGDVSPRALVGPIGLVQAAYRVASQGVGRFLLFLTLLSANLAVINFLPIPVLDGGHMAFLVYEGIRRKPPSEAVYVGLSYVGLAIIVAIILWVFGLDLGFISR
ncbi:MAG: site-2 protease family protein [Thermogutta sp.]